MKDDYLWDGSGKVDPEIERLEITLQQFKHQPRPLELPVKRPRPQVWLGLAAAAFVLLALTAGLRVYFSNQSSDEQANPPIAEQTTDPQSVQPSVPQQATAPQNVEPSPPPQLTKRRPAKPTNLAVAALASSRKPQNSIALAASHPTRAIDEARLTSGTLQPIIIPFLDQESARHIEKSQLLLRSFTNLRLAKGEKVYDAAYERQASQHLLSKNMLLRRTAEARGNLPVEELLGSIEPILLDISNLAERPSAQAVRAIKTRIQEREMIASLQIYLGQVASAGR